ncbi:MAG: amidohydrolase [Bacteroidales bacterium]
MRHLLKKILIISVLAMVSACQSPLEKVDLIIRNAVIYTLDEGFTMAQSAAIRDGVFVAVGTDKDIGAAYTATETMNMNGAFVYPGLIDPHAHFFGYGTSLMNPDLSGSRSFEEIIDLIKDHHERFSGEWILGRGWDQNLWPVQEFPHRSQLDAVFPDIPVLLVRVDGHAAIANTEALNRAGITANTRVPGGEVALRNGAPTGILIDNAIGLVRGLVPPLTRQQEIQALLNAQQNCFAVGLTSVSDAGLGRSTIELMDSLHQAGELQMRVYAMLSPTTENLETFMFHGPYKTDHLNVRSLKLFADGALGSRGAKLLEPYSDDPGNSGLLVETPEYLAEMSRKAFDCGYQVNTHCIGDSAVRLMLHIYGELLEGDNDRRWRIEHAQIIHPEDFDLFGKYQIVPSIQALHATSDMLWAVDRLGAERLKGGYAYQQLLKQNGWLPNGSDFPVEPINPLLGFYAAVERKNFDGIPPEGFQMENALTRRQALRAMTIWAAKSQFEEDEKGSIEEGKFADFVVTSQDLMTMPAAEINTLPIDMTFVGGNLVYSR